MTTYTVIAGTETDPDKPLKSDLAKRWSDNPLAIAEGDTSVPLNLFPSVLLGTLTTTSGTVQTLSSLVLTPYRFLYIAINDVSFTVATTTKILIDGKVASSSLTAITDVFLGDIRLNLATGDYTAITAPGTAATQNAGVSAQTYLGQTSYSTASTSISFSGGTFDAGQILVYGLK